MNLVKFERIWHLIKSVVLALLVLLVIHAGWAWAQTAELPGVSIQGTAEGLVNVPHTFTATINPVTGTVTLPITYTWQADDHSLKIISSQYLSNTAVFTWHTTGAKVITVTASNGGKPVADTLPVDIRPHVVYLPLVLRRWPPIPYTPVMSAIDNDDGDGNYEVSWSQADLADEYVLEEDDNSAFSSPTTVYTGTDTMWSAVDKSVGMYYYRVKAHNSWGYSGWSNVHSVTVEPSKCNLYVVNDTGGQLCYEIYNTDIGRKCFPSGTHYYGAFPAGTYSWQASAQCGSADGDRDYEPGDQYHRFWCGVSRSVHSRSPIARSLRVRP